MEYKKAKEIAIKLRKQLEPFCKYIEIVGSLRREKQDVKDIEFVIIPRTTKITDLFGDSGKEQRLNNFCIAVNLAGVIVSGDIKTGRYVKVMLNEDISLDIFMPNEDDLYRQVAIRTGSADYSHKVIAAGCLRAGWCGTRDGLRLQKECYQKAIGTYPDGREKKEWICNNPSPTLPPVWENEWEFFQFIGIPWIEPKNRVI